MSNSYYITGWSVIRRELVGRNDKIEPVTENFLNFATFIKNLYKKEAVSYPKFYKMDNPSKLGFLAAEILFKEKTFLDRYDKKETGIIIMNSGSSLDTDTAYNETIRDRSNYFPSPSVFVYTLPNIMIGEICIRHRINGENAFLVMEKFDAERIIDSVKLVMDGGRAQACLCGWVEVLGDSFEAILFFVEKDKVLKEQEVNQVIAPFTVEQLEKHYNIK